MRYQLMSENGNILEVGDTPDSREYMLFLCRCRFKNTIVSVMDCERMTEEFFDRDGNYRCIDWRLYKPPR